MHALLCATVAALNIPVSFQFTIKPARKQPGSKSPLQMDACCDVVCCCNNVAVTSEFYRNETF